MDLLSGYGASTRTSLNEIAAVLGLPGKIDGMDGSKVEEAAIAGRHDEICRYCEIDTVMLYCAWLRFQLAAGDLTPDSHAASLALLGEAIVEMGENGHIWQRSGHWGRPNQRRPLPSDGARRAHGSASLRGQVQPLLAPIWAIASISTFIAGRASAAT